LSGILDDFLDSRQWVPILETNRGCPYACTFCVWGISALDKVRVFPLERSFQEIEYVAKRSPSPRWIFADANFGMLPRDLDLARKIREESDKYGKLKMAQVWWAKNSSKNTLEISKIFGSLTDPLAAVQSLDETVLKNIKRDNIKLNTMTDLLEQWSGENIGVTTDVLVGLPGESLESHLKTLRRVFDHGFSYVEVGNIRLLPGSEMETDECRQTYGLKTKYRLISGSYGKYDGIPVFEYEESVRSSNHITEEEMHYLRIIHFFIWVFWNLGIAKPLLKWIQSEHGKNPVDVFIELAKPGKNSILDQFIHDFDTEARNEWFDTVNDLNHYYKSNFDSLIEKGFLKLNPKYLSKLILDKALTRSLIDVLVEKYKSKISVELGNFCCDQIFFLDSSTSKECKYDEDTLNVLRMIYPHITFEGNTCFFEQQKGIQEAINYELKKFNFETEPIRALTLTMETYRNRFLYDFSFSPNGNKETSGELLGGSFDYHAQLGPLVSETNSK